MERNRYTADAKQKDRAKNTIVEILKKTQEIHFSYIFGSFLDENTPFGDIDLGVYFAGKNQAQMSEAAISLAITMTRETGYPVDVRVLNCAPASFVYNVLKGQLIYERNEEIRCQIMENTVRTYLDMKPILYRATKEAFSSESQS